MNKLAKKVIFVVCGILFVVALVVAFRGDGGGRRGSKKVEYSSGVATETREKREYKRYEDVDGTEAPTAYETRPSGYVEETTMAETIQESESNEVLSDVEYDENGNPIPTDLDNKTDTSSVREDNYKHILISAIAGSEFFYEESRDCFTDNYFDNVDAFNESNPLYKNIEMNEWYEGEYMSGECVIHITDIDKYYRYEYTVIGGKFDSITYVGEE